MKAAPLKTETLGPESSQGRQVRSGAVWSGLSTLVLRLANIAIMAVVVRIITPRDFGVFAVALTVHAVVASVSELGLASVLTRRDTDAARLAPTVATAAFLSGAVLATGMYVSAPLLASALGAPEAYRPIRVLSLCVLMVGVFAVPGALLARDFRQRRIFGATMIAFGPSNALLVVLALHGDGAMAFAWSRVLGQVVMGVVMTLSVRRFGWGWDKSSVRFILSIGLPLAGTNLVNYTLLNVDYAVVGRTLGAVALGAYLLAYTVSNWATSLMGAMVNGVAMPAFSKLTNDPRALTDGLMKATRGVALLAWPVAALTLASAGPLIATVYGSQWGRTAGVLPILATYGAVHIHCLVLSNLLVGTGHAKALFAVQLLWISALVPVLLVGVHLGGLRGLAAGNVAVISLIVLPAYLTLIRRRTGARLAGLAGAVLPIMLCAGVAGCIAWVVGREFSTPATQLLVGCGAGGLFYTLAVAPELCGLLLGDKAAGRVTRVVRLLELPRRLIGRRATTTVAREGAH